MSTIMQPEQYLRLVERQRVEKDLTLEQFLEEERAREAMATLAAKPDSSRPDYHTGSITGAGIPKGEERKWQARADSILYRLVGLVASGLRAFYHRPDRKPAPGEMAGLPDHVLAGSDAQRCPSCGCSVFAMEYKAQGGKLSPEQIAWLEAFGKRGRLVTSEEEMHRALKEWGFGA